MFINDNPKDIEPHPRKEKNIIIIIIIIIMRLCVMCFPIITGVYVKAFNNIPNSRKPKKTPGLSSSQLHVRALYV